MGSQGHHFTEDLKNTDFKGFKAILGLRLTGLLCTMFFLVALWVRDSFALYILSFALLLAFQIISLFKFLNRYNEEVLTFLNSIKFDDVSLTYTTNSNNSTIDHLNKEFKKVMDNLREIRKEKETDFQYVRNIVQHIGIGLITFDIHGNVQILNRAAKKILAISNLKNINELTSKDQELVDIFFRLKRHRQYEKQSQYYSSF